MRGASGTCRRGSSFQGESAHSARPWTGLNAIHELVRGLAGLAELEPVDVELDGLVYREVVSAVRVEGGIASNVVPARASAELNFRYAPGRSPAGAEARLRELVPHGEIDVLHNSPAAPPALTNPLVAASARARPGGRAEAGVDARRPVRRSRASTRSTTARARRRTPTGSTSRSRSPASSAATRRWRRSSLAWRRDGPHLPDAGGDGDVSVRPPRGGAPASRRRGCRGDRLRQGRPERADRPEHPAGADRRAAGACALPARTGSAGAAAGGADWVDRRFGVALDPDTEIVPTYGSKEAIFSLRPRCVDRGRSHRRLLRAGLSRLRARRALRRRPACARCRSRASTASCPISTLRSTTTSRSSG